VVEPVDAIELITFDLGGTLLSPHPSVGEAYAEELEQLGYHVDPARLQMRFHRALRNWTESNGTGANAREDKETWRAIVTETLQREAIPEKERETVFEHLYAAFAKASRWRIHDGTRETLEALTERGYRLAVLSNNDSRCRQVLREHALLDFFEALFLSGELGYEKPHPKLFQHVMEATGLRAGQILHVGDSPRHDLEPARACGWKAVIVSSHGKSLRDLLEELPPRRPEGTLT
jgi:putative hydrolase of the HAD superfamily